MRRSTGAIFWATRPEGLIEGILILQRKIGANGLPSSADLRREREAASTR